MKKILPQMSVHVLTNPQLLYNYLRSPLVHKQLFFQLLLENLWSDFD